MLLENYISILAKWNIKKSQHIFKNTATFHTSSWIEGSIFTFYLIR